MVRILDPDAHAQVRGRILVAARGLFASKGYHATSMNEVARASGLAKAAVYHYFDGKKALLLAMHQDLFEDAEEKLRALPRLSGLREAWLRLGRGYLEHFKEPGPAELMSIALNVHPEDPEFLTLSSTLFKPRMEALLDDFLGAYLPKGTPKGQARRLAMPFFGALYYYLFVLQRTCAGKELPGEEEYLNTLADVFSAAPLAAAGKARQKRASAGSVPRRAKP